MTTTQATYYSTVADHDCLPDITVSEQQLEDAHKEVFGTKDEFKPVPLTSFIDSVWAERFDQFYQQHIVWVRSNNVLLLRFAYTYEVDLDRIKTEGHLLAWTKHLVTKPWMSPERTKMFIDVVSDIKGFDSDL
jgi:hypothetical protein